MRKNVRIARLHRADDALGDLLFRLLKACVDRYDDPIQLVEHIERHVERAVRQDVYLRAFQHADVVIITRRRVNLGDLL